MELPLYFLIICATVGVEMPCPAMQTERAAYSLTREDCLAQMRWYLAKEKYQTYAGFCVRWGGTEVLDRNERAITAGLAAGVLVPSRADYIRASSAGARPRPPAAR
jgi:hypothetical protein